MSVINNEWTKAETVKFFLLGFTQDKISKELKISIGSVNTILNEALSHDKTLELQRQIAIQVNKNKTTVKQIAANLRWKNAIKLRGLDDKAVEKILDLMETILNKNNIPPATTANLLYSSIDIIMKNQLDPDRVEEEIRVKKNELDSVKEEIRMENAKLEKLKVRVDAQLEKSKLNEKTLDMLNDLSTGLNLYDLEVIDLLQLPRIIEGFKKLGWDTTTIIDKYKAEQDLELGIKKQQSKMKKHEAVLEDLYRKRTEEKRKWGIYYDAFQIFNKLVESGLKPEDIFKASYILKNNFTPETVSQLLEDIEKYGSIAAATVKLERVNINANAEPSNIIDTFQ
ncbi:MAG: hypothetical protein M3O68_04325 [Thermoproteota archaeon]|nr:hypothetical protein [Thermoproteota archaeon]